MYTFNTGTLRYLHSTCEMVILIEWEIGSFINEDIGTVYIRKNYVIFV